MKVELLLKPLFERLDIAKGAMVFPSFLPLFLDKVVVDLAKEDIKKLVGLVLQVGCENGLEDEMKKTLLGLVDCALDDKGQNIELALIEMAEEKISQYPSHQGKIAFFGLSGNPPTLNHLALIKHLADSDKFEKTLVILNASSPLKETKDYSALYHRIKMLERMLNANIQSDKVIISDLETARKPPSKMVITLALFHLLQNRPKQVTLVLGKDALILKNNKPQISYWYQFEKLIKLCHLKFYPRDGVAFTQPNWQEVFLFFKAVKADFSIVFNDKIQINAMIKALPFSLQKEVLPKCLYEDITLSEGSSTEIRKHYHKNQSKNPPFVDESVANYIEKHKLYR